MKRNIVNTILSVMIGSIVLCGCGDSEDIKENIKEAVEENIEIPSKYDLRDEGRVTSRKYQGKPGTCWAYAAASTAESNLITKGYEKSEVDLSENHMVYYSAYYDEENPMESSSVDGIYITGEKTQRYQLPYGRGTAAMAFLMMSNGMGPVTEEAAPIIVNEEKESAELMYQAEQEGKITRYMGDYLLTDYSTFPSYTDIDVVKKEIMKKGAVAYSSAFNFGTSYKAENGEYAIYASKPGAEFHVFSLIGWDDDYSREHFVPEKPERDGAWLVKDTTSLSEDGYLWLSYDFPVSCYDSASFSKKSEYASVLAYDNMGPTMMQYSKMIKDGKGNRDDYQEIGLLSEGESTVIANVFTSPDDNEMKAAGVFALAENQKIRIKVYRNPSDDNPTSGELADEVETQTAYLGYHVVDLNKSISLSAGDRFSIVVEYYGDDWINRIAPVEMPIDYNDAKVELGEYMHFGSNAGESYALMDDVWYDLSKKETAEVFGKKAVIHNAAIKALLAN